MQVTAKQILAAFLILILLSACSTTNSNTLNGNLGESPFLTHDSLLPTEKRTQEPTQNEPKVESVTYANIGFKENDVFTTDSSQDFFPISCICDGEQFFAGDFQENSERFDNLEAVLAMAPAVETLDLVDVKEHMFIGSNRPDYGFDWVATTGDWELFPEAITYTSYDLDHQPNVPEWAECFRNALAEYDIDSPVVIKDSWAFQWGGVESIIVTATNAVPCENGSQYYSTGEEPIPEDLPINKKPGVYLISAMFRTGQEPITIRNLILSLPNDMGRSALASDSEYGVYERSISVVQYNESGTASLYPVYYGHGGGETMRLFWYLPEYLLCDVDGNHEIELVVYYRAVSSLYTKCIVYNLVEGIPISSYSPIP